MSANQRRSLENALQRLTRFGGLRERIVKDEAMSGLGPLKRLMPELEELTPERAARAIVYVIQTGFAGVDQQLLLTAYDELPGRPLGGTKSDRLESFDDEFLVPADTARKRLHRILIPQLAGTILDPEVSSYPGGTPGDGYFAGLASRIAHHRLSTAKPKDRVRLSLERLDASSRHLDSDAVAVDPLAIAIHEGKLGNLTRSNALLDQLQRKSLSARLHAEVLVARARNLMQAADFAEAELLLAHILKLVSPVNDDALRRTLFCRRSFTLNVLGEMKQSRYFADGHDEVAGLAPHQRAVGAIYLDFLSDHLAVSRPSPSKPRVHSALDGAGLYPESPDLRNRYTHPEISARHADLLEVYRSSLDGPEAGARAAVAAGSALNRVGATAQAEGVGELMVGIRQLPDGPHLALLINESAAGIAPAS